MIQKAIEKIDREIENNKNNPYVMVCGNKVKNNLLANDSNALKILAPNTDLETFSERVKKIIDSMRSGKIIVGSPTSERKVIAIIKGIDEKEVTDDMPEAAYANMVLKDAFKAPNGVYIPDQVEILWLKIYYGIPFEEKAEAAAPKRRRFSAVSLD